MKKTSLILAFIFTLILVPAAVSAYSVKSAPAVNIGADEKTDGTLYAAGSTVNIDGDIDGDLICAGQTINVNGSVTGDIICAGETIMINGEIGGSVRLAGNTVSLNSKIAHNAQIFSATMLLGNNAKIAWDLLFVGAIGDVKGEVTGDLHGSAGHLTISGKVGGNIDYRLDENISREKRFGNKVPTPLTVTKDAEILGDINYTAGLEGNIEEGAQIGGQTNFTLAKKISGSDRALNRAWSLVFSVFSAFVVGLVLISLWRVQLLSVTDKMLKEAGKSIGVGAIILIMVPVIIILLLFTLIGIPLSFILTALYVIALYLSRILTAVLVGRSITDKVWNKKKDSLIWAMILGVLSVWLLSSVPAVGWMISLVSVWWGLGGIWSLVKKS